MTNKELSSYWELPVEALEQGLIGVIANLPYGEKVELFGSAPGFPDAVLGGLQRIAFATEAVRGLYDCSESSGDTLRDLSA